MEQALDPADGVPALAGASQASSHFPLEPVNGLVLLQREVSRRNTLRRRGNLFTGCRELDEEVLAGGFERGCVVGVSAEQEDIGLLLGLQTIARLLVTEAVTEAPPAEPRKPRPRTMIVTTLDAGALLPTLRRVVEAQVELLVRDQARAKDAARACLEQISISRIFDMEGLWEVLRELDTTVAAAEAVVVSDSSPNPDLEHEASRVADPVPQPGPASPLQEAGAEPVHVREASQGDPAGKDSGPARKSRRRGDVVMDSEDEDDAMLSSASSSELSSPPPSSTGSSSPPPNPPPPATTHHFQVEEDGAGATAATEEQPEPVISELQCQRPPPPRLISTTPDIILVTHMAALFTTLFRSRDKQSAHTTLGLLASHLRHISRSQDYGSPLIMLLNATNSPSDQQDERRRPGPSEAGGSGSSRPLDPTLRSIFNLPYLPGLDYYPDSSATAAHTTTGGPGGGGSGGPLGGGAPAAAAATRRNKPVYGLVFSQLLDLHLLATLVPRTRSDAEAVVGRPGPPPRLVCVFEVLLDELGAWQQQPRGPADIAGAAGAAGTAGVEGRDAGDGNTTTTVPPRMCREQRWGAVEVLQGSGSGGGGRIVDGFAASGAEPRRHTGKVAVAGGFGGLRV